MSAPTGATTVDLSTLSDTITEAEFQRAVIDMARHLGWMVYHARPARTANGWRTAMSGDPGFPDLILARDGELICAELKRNNGRLSIDQKAWIQALGAFGEVWRPRDMDAIEARLRRPVTIQPAMLGQ